VSWHHKRSEVGLVGRELMITQRSFNVTSTLIILFHYWSYTCFIISEGFWDTPESWSLHLHTCFEKSIECIWFSPCYQCYRRKALPPSSTSLCPLLLDLSQGIRPLREHSINSITELIHFQFLVVLAVDSRLSRQESNIQPKLFSQQWFPLPPTSILP